MKKLITGAAIREMHAAKQMSLTVVPNETIVTPEARTVAEDLGIDIVEDLSGIDHSSSSNSRKGDASSLSGNNLIREIRNSIVAQLPDEQKNNQTLIDQLIDKVMKQGAKMMPVSTKDSSSDEGSFQEKRAHSGVKVVKGDSVKYGLFEGAGRENSVGIIDLIGADDNSPMAAGFMTWQKAFFPWKLTYDEINFVIEGELHIRTEGETIIGRAGDLLFIPKGSSIEFGTPTHVRFLFVSYPVNWAD